MTRYARKPLAALALLALAASGVALGASPQSTELWGGPGARGSGQFGAQFDTIIYLSALSDATCTVDYFGGTPAGPVVVNVPARGVVAVPTPDSLMDKGAFLFRIRSTAAVTAWSETFNRTATGQFGLGLATFTTAEFLNPGDEANGGGADASSSTEMGRSRTNAGILCNPGSAQGCQAELTVFRGGDALGSGLIEAAPGHVSQYSIADLVPAAAGQSLLALRFRVIAGSAQPYATKVTNSTSDGSEVSLSVVRSAFSTAPHITSFTVDPSSGCAPQVVNLSWTTSGASRVTISGATGDLPPNGSTTVSLASTTDLVLTAYAASGEASNETRHVTVLPGTSAPTPYPSEGTASVGGFLDGILPPLGGSINYAFVQQESEGSTFQITGNTYHYTAGSTAGTDIVRITIEGPCGPASADFVANVIAPGSPRILTFTAEPARGCSPAGVVLYWTTTDASFVQLSGVPFNQPGTGAYGTTIASTTTFKLTAFGFDGSRTSKSLTVPVDFATETPILSAYSANVLPNGSFPFTVSGVSNPENIVVQLIQRGSGGGYLQQTGTGTYIYFAGGTVGEDIFWLTYRNGCGFTYAEFKGTTTISP